MPAAEVVLFARRRTSPVLSTDELLERCAGTKDARARELVCERFAGLARHLATKYHHPAGEPFEDLEQVAHLGLLKAIDRFDPARGFSFVTFATPTILGELRRHFRDHTHVIHLPRQLGEDIQRVDKAIRRLSAATGSPTPMQIARAADLSVDCVLEALAASRASTPRTLDMPIGNADLDESPLVEHIGAVDPGFDAVEYGVSARAAVLALSPRDRDILRLRFVEDLTQTQIANRIGLSQMQVSRVVSAATRALRAAATTPPD